MVDIRWTRQFVLILYMYRRVGVDRLPHLVRYLNASQAHAQFSIFLVEYIFDVLQCYFI